MKTNITKLAAVLSVMTLAVAANAQVVIGSWQDSTAEGWIDWGNSNPITDPSNTAKYSFVNNAVTGYGKSLQISKAGYNQNLALKLEYQAGQVAAFLTNHLLSFTFSVPSSAASGSTSGYSQLATLSVNAQGYGFHDIPLTSLTSTGDVGNNQNGQPNFYFYSGAPARSQTVTLDYSSLLPAITATAASGYVELIFTFNNGGGAATNYYINNVNLSGPIFIVDDFATTGVGSANDAGHDYYFDFKNNAAVNYPYNAGGISNVWSKWFGNALTNVTWDGTSDAAGAASSGSMRLDLDWSQDSQFVLWNQGPGNNYFQVNAGTPTYTNFQCDIRFAAGSASSAGNGTTPGGQPIFGHVRFGDRPSDYSQDWFGAVDVIATNTNWVHVSIPLDVVNHPGLANINGIIVGIDKNYYNLNLTTGSTMWIDNIALTGPSTTVTNPPPVIAVQKAVPSLRIFAGSTVNTYDREELATVNQSQSWIGGSYPVSYSFTLLSAPNLENFQTHMFLIPTAQANASIYGNEYLDYNASNSVWLQINGNTNGTCTANVAWKVNLPNSNPNNVAVNITNSTPVGTWTVRFTSAGAGTLTAPGASPVAFTIADANVSTDFANPLVAIFGIQPQSAGYYGSYVDYANISISGTGGAISEDFTHETAISGNWDLTDSAYANSLVLVSTNTPYWVYWTLPDDGFGLGVAPNLVTGNWMLPEFYNGYADGGPGNVIPATYKEGTSRWTLVPKTTLPTVNATQGGTLSPNGYYRLFKPALSN